jgi:surfactin synthase thioesterase subunit
MNDKINLYCIPYAGGSFYAYREFERYMADFIRMIPLELPGRGKRFKEPLLTDIYEMVDDLFHQIKMSLHEPYAIYGHSLGALLGYLLVKKIIEKDFNKPVHLFFSGRQGPSLMRGRKLHLLPKKALIDQLISFGGIPDELLREQQLIDFFEPIIRADFKAHETYQYEKSQPVATPLTVMAGLHDKETTYDEAMTWQEVTTETITIRQFPGGHFFIFNNLSEIAMIFSEQLDKAVTNKKRRFYD